MTDSSTCFGQLSNKPLKEYSDEQTAAQQAQYVLKRYGNQMTPYQFQVYLCPHGRGWHLASKTESY